MNDIYIDYLIATSLIYLEGLSQILFFLLLMYIASFISIFFHECGHFFVMRKYGSTPKLFVISTCTLFSLRWVQKIKNTTVVINLLPIFGYVETMSSYENLNYQSKRIKVAAISGIFVNSFLLALSVLLFLTLDNSYIVKYLSFETLSSFSQITEFVEVLVYKTTGLEEFYSLLFLSNFAHIVSNISNKKYRDGYMFRSGTKYDHETLYTQDYLNKSESLMISKIGEGLYNSDMRAEVEEVRKKESSQ